MSAPSLFSSTRCVVVRGLEGLPDECLDGMLDYAAAPADDVALVLVHGGGPKGSGLLTKLRKLGRRSPRSKSEEIKASELTGLRHRGGSPARAPRSTPTRRRSWCTAVGADLRSLAAAAHQLTNDFPGEQLTVEKVKRYFGGRAEAKSFAVADAAFAGRKAQALEELRWAMDGGTASVLVTSAMAGSARGLARFSRRPQRDARGRPGPRAGRAAVEGAHDPRPVPVAGPTPAIARGDPRGRRRPTPTSRGRPAMRRTPSSGWCSPSPTCAPGAEPLASCPK